MTLTDAHRQMLMQGSAITEALIRQRGYESLPQPADLIDRGFSKTQAKTAPALGIPLWNVQGQRHGWQIRPDCPRQMKDGKVFRYEMSKGDRLILDVHPSVQPLVGDPHEPLWITEGIRKGDALASQGVCAIALIGGVWGFRGTNEHGGKVILPDWEHVALNDRLVYVAFDSDLATKPNVQAALAALWALLRSKQARPARVDWPEAFQQQKWGVDDFLARGHTMDELRAMIPPMGPLPPKPPSPPAQGRHSAPPVPPLPITDPAAILGTVSPCTHVANARRIARLYGPTLRYVLGEGWILWTGKFWRPDPTTEGALATGFVSALARSIAEEAAALYSAAAQTPTETERKALYALAEARGQWAVQSENATVIAAGLKLAKHDLLLTHDAINTNPWLLNCENATIDLTTGEVRAHNPADLITHIAPATYDPAATCPTWQRFLTEVFEGDTSMVAFMQRAFGWALTGVVQERALFFLYGAQGHNGKTTMVETMRDLLGTSGEESFGYARKVDVTTFMKSKNHEDNLRKTAQLTGARFVFSSEVDEEHRLNEQLVKDMTGGDTIEARRLYREAFTFKPTFKAWMYGNHKPEIRGTDDALWSRVKLIEFPVSFADRADLTLPAKLRAEMSGILNWAIAGCLAWQQEGLKPPARVKTTTQAYREEQDLIGQFIRECCQTGETYMRCKAAKLYAAYRRWTEDNGHGVLSQHRFGTYLTAHGYPSDNNPVGRGACRERIALLGPANDEEEDESDTLSWRRVSDSSSSNDAGKPHFTSPSDTLDTLSSRKCPIEQPHEGLPESKGIKGIKSPSHSSYVIENARDSVDTLRSAKGINAEMVKPPQFCEGCGKQTCWIDRGSYVECSNKQCRRKWVRPTR